MFGAANIRTVMFCNSGYELYTQDYGSWYYVLFLLYVLKLWLLTLQLEYFSVTLQSLVISEDEDSVCIFPITMPYYTRRSLHWVDYTSGNLLILMLIIQKLEKIFLGLRDKVLTDDDLNNDIYYDNNIDITACYIKAKQQLQQCKADHEDLNRQFKNAENQRNKLQKQVNSLEKDLSKLKEANSTDMKELRCCICHDKQSNILLRPCNHLSLCEECLKNGRCPLCRKKIKETIKVFS